MRPKFEKTLGIVALIGSAIGLTILYIIGPDNFSDPVMTEYIAKLILYPSGLISIRFAWKSSLDNKIRSKGEREEDFRKAVKENEAEK